MRRANKRLALFGDDLSESALGHTPADLRADDDNEADEQHDSRDGDHLRQVARETQRAVEVDRERLARPDDERGESKEN
jgi:hypothetical protein